MIPLQKVSIFEHVGIDAINSELNTPDKYYTNIENAYINKQGVISKREGKQLYGASVSSNSIKQLDRYITESSEEIITSVDKKLYWSNTDTTITTTLFFRGVTDAATPFLNYVPTTNSIDILLNSATHPFVVDDYIFFTVGADDYILVVTNVAGDTLTCFGISTDLTATLGAITIYGGRESDILLVADATDFRVGDMISIDGYNRWFKILSIDTSTTPNEIQIDEDLFYKDGATAINIDIPVRHEQFSYCDRDFNYAVTASDVTDEFTLPALAIEPVNGWGVYVTTTGGLGDIVPEPIVEGKKYFIVDATATTFKLAEEEGGTAIDLTTTGTGVVVINFYDAPVNSIFSASSTQPDIFSCMLRKSMIMVDGENEPLKYDGVEVNRLGFHEVPDLYDDWIGQKYSCGALNTGDYFYLTSELVSATTQAGAETVTKVAHGLSNGDRVVLFNIVTTTGISNDIMYFVVNKTNDTFQLSLTLGGAVVLMDTGDGTCNYMKINQHGFTDGTPIQFNATAPAALPTNVVGGTTYYVKYYDAYAFNIASSVGGSTFVIASQGTQPFYGQLTESTFVGQRGLGSVDVGERRFKVTYSKYDNNGELEESGTVEERAVDVITANSNVFIPVPVIPWKVNDELKYNVNSCLVNLYVTKADETLDYYLANEVQMSTLGNFSIASITKDGSTAEIEIMPDASGNYQDLSNLVIGDYLFIKATKEDVNNGIFEILSVDNTNHLIVVRNYGAITEAAPANDGSIGYCAVCIRYNITDDILETNSLLYCNRDSEPENDAPPIAKYVTSFDNRIFMLNGKSYQESLVGLKFPTPHTMLSDGDTIEINDGTNSEVYELCSAGTAPAGVGAFRIDLGKITTNYLLLQYLSEAINSNPYSLVWAYYERVAGDYTLVLRERRRNSNKLNINITLSNTDNFYNIRIGNTWLNPTYSGLDIMFTQSSYTSRIWWTKDGEPSAFVGSFGGTTSQQVYYQDIAPSNGQELTGAGVLGSYLMSFKEDSYYKGSLADANIYTFQSVDTEFGCVAPRTICSIGSDIAFLSRQGVRGTDGTYTKNIGNDLYKEWFKLEPTMLDKACATHFSKLNQYWVTVAYNTSNTPATENNITFVYDYQRGGWFRYTNQNHVLYTKIKDILFMATTEGEIFTYRNSGDETDYRDDSEAIEATVETKWFDLGDKSSRKMFMNIIMHLYQETIPASADIYYAVDLERSYQYFSTISLDSPPWGYFSWGDSPWGAAIAEPHKQPLRPKKVLYTRFKFVNDIKDSTLNIHGYDIEFKPLNTKLLKQPE